MSEESEKADTIPPEASNHGFLEQFEILSHATLADLAEVVQLGITQTERMTLVKVGIQLLHLALKDLGEEEVSPEIQAELDQFLASLIPTT